MIYFACDILENNRVRSVLVRIVRARTKRDELETVINLVKRDLGTYPIVTSIRPADQALDEAAWVKAGGKRDCVGAVRMP